jgi:Tfp pilus assembly protein PilF
MSNSSLEKLVSKAQEAINEKRFGKAINNLTYALDIDKNNYKYLVQRCFCFLQTNENEEALKDAEVLMEMNQKDAKVWKFN